MADKLKVADELKKMNKLKKDGLLTDDEFNEQKSKLLGTESEDKKPIKVTASDNKLGTGNVIAIIVSVIVVIMFFSMVNNKPKDTDDNNSTNSSEVLKDDFDNTIGANSISKNDAEELCQDASITGSFTRTYNVSLIDVWTYNAKYTDNGDGTGNLTWNGKDKDTDYVVAFSCDVTTGKDTAKVTKLTAILDNMTHTLIGSEE